MYFNIKSFLIVGVLAACVTAQQSPNLTLKMMYETYCPLSIKFFTENFYPAYLKDFKNVLNVTMNPAGNMTSNYVNGTYSFQCEHGPKECYGNKVHACVLTLNSAVVNEESKLKFVNCSLATVNTNGTNYPIDECALVAGIDSRLIYSCVNGIEGNKTLDNFVKEMEKYGNVSIPSVVVNDMYNQTQSETLIDNFPKAFCNLLISRNYTAIDACKNPNNSAPTVTLTVLPVVIFTFLFSKLYQ